MPAKRLLQLRANKPYKGTFAVYIANNYLGTELVNYIDVVTLLTFVDGLPDFLGNGSAPSRRIFTGYQGDNDFNFNIAVRRFGYQPGVVPKDANGNGWRKDMGRRISGLANKHLILIDSGGHEGDEIMSALKVGLERQTILSLLYVTHSKLLKNERDEIYNGVRGDQAVLSLIKLLNRYSGVIIPVDKDLHLFS